MIEFSDGDGAVLRAALARGPGEQSECMEAARAAGLYEKMLAKLNRRIRARRKE